MQRLHFCCDRAASIIHCCIAGDCGDMVCVGSDPTTAYCKPGTVVGSACSATGDLLSVSCHAFIGTLKTSQAMQQGRCMGRIFSWVLCQCLGVQGRFVKTCNKANGMSASVTSRCAVCCADTCDRGLVCSNGSCATLEAGTSCSQTSKLSMP